MATFDTIVIGLGAMGSAAAAHLASRGQRVLGLEQFTIGHDPGKLPRRNAPNSASLLRKPSYVPLLFRAYELWDQLAAEAGEELFVRNGLLIYGRPSSSQVYRGALESGRQYKIPLEEVPLLEAEARWPAYRAPQGYAAAFEPGAGYLRAELCTIAHAVKARRYGAELKHGETVLSFETRNGTVKVRTDKGNYEAARIVVAGGGWSSRLLSDLKIPLELRRMLLAWFRADRAHEKIPGFIFDLDSDFYYGFPSIDGATIKIAGHHGFETMREPEEKDTVKPGAERIERLENFIAECLPHAKPGLVKSAHCIYTMTPDENFVVDRHPGHPEVTFAAGFSGHGFKFASVIGEILADLSESGRTLHPVEFLAASRFSN